MCPAPAAASPQRSAATSAGRVRSHALSNVARLSSTGCVAAFARSQRPTAMAPPLFPRLTGALQSTVSLVSEACCGVAAAAQMVAEEAASASAADGGAATATSAGRKRRGPCSLCSVVLVTCAGVLALQCVHVAVLVATGAAWRALHLVACVVASGCVIVVLVRGQAILRGQLEEARSLLHDLIPAHVATALMTPRQPSGSHQLDLDLHEMARQAGGAGRTDSSHGHGRGAPGGAATAERGDRPYAANQVGGREQRGGVAACVWWAGEEVWVRACGGQGRGVHDKGCQGCRDHTCTDSHR